VRGETPTLLDTLERAKPQTGLRLALSKAPNRVKSPPLT
jgi:hypothetical protein